jgi:hypothetical protein
MSSEAAGMDVGPVAALVDRADIVDRLSQYCYAVDFGDWSLLDLVFAEDVSATYILEPHGLDDVHFSDRGSAVDWLRSVLGETSGQVPMHAMANHLITVEGDVARSRSYLAGRPGMYTVEWRRTAEGWRAATWEMRNFPLPRGAGAGRQADR